MKAPGVDGQAVHAGLVAEDRAAAAGGGGVDGQDSHPVPGGGEVARRSGMAKERITVVRNGIDLAAIPSGVTHDRGNDRVVGYLGTMNPQDGIEILLHAIHHIRHVMNRADVCFVLIGDGGSHKSLVRLAADLNVDDVVTFTGRLLPQEALSTLGSCAVCVQPDPKNEFTDTCCMVKTLEYMSLGKPIVAFGLSETQKCCAHAAIYAEMNSFVDLAKNRRGHRRSGIGTASWPRGARGSSGSSRGNRRSGSFSRLRIGIATGPM